MKRSLAVIPALLDSLESRVVLSAVHLVAAQFPASQHKLTPAQVAPFDIAGTKQETFSTGLVQTTQRTLLVGADGAATAQDIITNSDGSSEVDLATGSQSNGTTTVHINKTFSSGMIQSEVDTETSTIASGTLRGDGTVVPGRIKAGLVVSTNFTRVTTQAGLNSQVITGTSIAGLVNKHFETITNQQVINFDGTVDHVHIVSVQAAKPRVTKVTRTVTHADGIAVTTSSTIKILSGSIDGYSFV